MMLIDVLLALALGTVFIAGIASISIGSRDLFWRAREQSRLLDDYEAHNAHESPPRFYGNDRMEEEISTSSLIFTRIYSRPLAAPDDAAGTPLCGADITNRSPIGLLPVHSAVPTITPITLPINPLLPLTDIEVRDGIAFISTDSSTASDPDILIADIRDPSKPSMLSSINTGPGISALALAGDHIFAAAASTAAELHVIRINALDSLFLENKYRLPLPYATATPPLGSSIFYDKGKAYLGTEKWDGDEFSIINVSNPAQPVRTGGSETGSKVNDIYVRDDSAFVAASDQDQLRIIDIHDPGNPAQKYAFSPSGWQRQEGKAANIFEYGLDLGRTSGGFNIATDHEAFSWATSTLAGSVAPVSADMPGGVYGIVSDRSHIYLATRNIGHEFSIFDRSLTASTSYPLPVAPQAMVCDNDRLYILAHTAPVIYELSFN